MPSLTSAMTFVEAEAMETTKPPKGLTRFNFYPRDWLTGTRGLSMEARGAYIDILVMMYENGGPIPYDLPEMCGHFGLRSVRVLRRLIDELIAKKKISIQDGCLVNARATVEIETAHRAIEKAAEYGRMGGRPRKPATPETKTELHECLPELSTKHRGNIAEVSSKLGRVVEVNQSLTESHPLPSPPPSFQEEREKQVSLSLSVGSAKAEAAVSVVATGGVKTERGSDAEPILPLLDGETASASKPVRRPKRTTNGSPEIDAAFDRFWLAYPRRDGSDPRDAAKKAFIRAVKEGTNAEVLVHAAEGYAQEMRQKGKVDTEFVRASKNWLKDGDWQRYTAENVRTGSFGEGKPEPAWKTNPRAWTDRDRPPPWDDAPSGQTAGLWLKTSTRWVRN